MLYRALLVLAIPTVLAVSASEAQAQKKGGHPAAEHAKKPKKQKVTPDRALDVTRVVLVEQGYRVVRVESLGGSRVVYFCRGNNGRGKGCGPVMKMYVRPAAESVIFESAPRPVLLQLNVRLGL